MRIDDNELKLAIHSVVNGYPRIYNKGLKNSEVIEIAELFEDLDQKMFDSWMTGNACAVHNGDTINYLHDVERALVAGLKNT